MTVGTHRKCKNLQVSLYLQKKHAKKAVPLPRFKSESVSMFPMLCSTGLQIKATLSHIDMKLKNLSSEYKCISMDIV